MTQRVISPEQQASLARFAELFLKWNASINLSAARTRAELAAHIEDSLQVLPFLDGARDVLDVGSGGGLPVVVAALCCPTIHFTALEPVHKKHAFLRTAARELALSNLAARAERWEQHTRRDYDLAMSRATFDLREWFEIGLQFVTTGGRVLGFEGLERDDLPRAERHPYEIGGKQRAIVVVQRVS